MLLTMIWVVWSYLFILSVIFVFQLSMGFSSLTCPDWTCARVIRWPGTCLAWAQRLMYMGSCSRATLSSFRAWGKVQPCSFLTPLWWLSCSLIILVSASVAGTRCMGVVKWGGQEWQGVTWKEEGVVGRKGWCGQEAWEIFKTLLSLQCMVHVLINWCFLHLQSE